MARPRKCRKVCVLPKCRKFIPINWDNTETITLFFDEAEAIRLIDKEGLTQEETATMMGVARTTVQQIYQEARVKIANAIVDGKALVIKGGEVEVCSAHCCGMNKCYKADTKNKVVAIPVDRACKQIYEDFAFAPYYAIYNLDSNSSKYIKNEWQSGLEVASALCEKNISYVITHELGVHVKNFFEKAGVKIIFTDEVNFELLINNIGEKINE